VGSYVFARYDTLLNAAATTAGSNLNPTNGAAWTNYPIPSGAALSGTWRCMGFNKGPYASASNSTLYVRIS